MLHPKEVAYKLGVSTTTIHRWDQAGKLRTVCTVGNQRRFPIEEILLRKQGTRTAERYVLYARVSSVRQEQSGNLTRQAKRLKEAATDRGYEVVQVITEQASGLNEKRKGVKKLLALIAKQIVDVVLIEYPNRLVRFGFSYTAAHPDPLPSFNFSEQFPEFPFIYRRSVIKDAIGKVRSFLSHVTSWNASGKKRGQPGLPGASNYPTLYDEAFCLDLDGTDLQTSPRTCFARLKVYTGTAWRWHHYPIKQSRYFEGRWRDPAWESQSPQLILRKKSAALHFPQVKQVEARKVNESKEDPHLVTVAVDLNVKNLAVITVRQDGRIIETVFVPDHGLDQARFRHLKRIAKKQWQSGKPIRGEHSNQQLWGHMRRMNEDAAHKVSRIIANVCARYPGCVLLFERLRKIKSKGTSKSRRMNRRQANQLRGKINRYAKDKAYAQGTVTVEVNPHGTSQYCSRCGAKGERFSYQDGKRIQVKWGKLFGCPVCHVEVNADWNASVNIHRSFYREWHWQPRKKPPPKAA